MSTKALCAKRSRIPVRTVAVAVVVATLGGCAAPVAPSNHSFAEVSVFRPRTAPADPDTAAGPAPSVAPRLNAASPTEATATAASAPVDPDTAVRRIESLLGDGGFTVEARSEGVVRLILATRMAAPEALRGEATCTLKAMRRPDFSASDLAVRVAPAAGGVSVSATARYVLVDLSLFSGELSRQTCRSNGALEAEVRRAALS